MLQDTFNTPQTLDHICSIIVQVPQFAVMLLMSPPEGVLFQYLILFVVLSDSPSFVVSQCQSILLEQGVNTWDTVVPAFFQIIQCQTSVLGLRFLPF